MILAPRWDGTFRVVSSPWARERGIRPLAMAPVLALALFAGPVGLLAYLLVRAIAR